MSFLKYIFWNEFFSQYDLSFFFPFSFFFCSSSDVIQWGYFSLSMLVVELQLIMVVVQEAKPLIFIYPQLETEARYVITKENKYNSW